MSTWDYKITHLKTTNKTHIKEEIKMTVKIDKLNENQVAKLINDLMIENYQLNGDTLNVYFNENIIEYEGLDFILIYYDLAITAKQIINKIPVLKRNVKQVKFYRKIDDKTYELIYQPHISEIMSA